MQHVTEVAGSRNVFSGLLKSYWLFQKFRLVTKATCRMVDMLLS